MSTSKLRVRPGPPDATGEIPLRRGSVDPRMRQRWVDARKSEGRRRLRLALVVVVVLGLCGAGWAILHSSVVAVRHLVVRDTADSPHLSANQLAAAAGLAGHPPLIDVHTARSVAELEALAWVGTATVVRHWPHTVNITVTERRPVAQVPVPGGEALVDASGRVLTGAEPPVAGLPLLTGVTGASPGAWLVGTGAGGGGAGSTGRLLAVAAALPPALSSSIQSLSSGADGLTASFGPAHIPVLLGADTQPTVEWSTLQAIATPAALAGVVRIDLRIPERPVLTPTGQPLAP